MPKVFSSLIQSDFGGGDHSNFEAVVVEGNALVHWFRDNQAGGQWRRAQVIAPSGVAGAGGIIQSDYTHEGRHGNFEVVVPLKTADGRADLWHFFHDNSDVRLPWRQAQRIASHVAGPGCIIQSDFTHGDHGNFEVVVPVFASDGSIDLWHFFHDNSDVRLPWRQAQRAVSQR